MKKFYILSVLQIALAALFYGAGPIQLWPGVSSDGSNGLVVSGSVAIGKTNRNALIAAMESGEDVAITVLGDSTSNETSEWAYLLGAAIGTLYPAYAVQHCFWNGTTQDYDAFATIQAGTSGVYYVNKTENAGVTVTDATIADFASDPDVRVKILPTAWPPAATSTIISHYGANDPNRSFQFVVLTSGYLRLFFSADGNAAGQFSKTTTAAATGSTTAAFWVRFTIDLDNGAVGHDTKFYTSTDGNSWTQVGDTVTTAGTTTLAAVNATWDLGDRPGDLDPYNNIRFYEAEIRDGIDAWPPSNTFGIESWTYASAGTLVGGPTLRIFNGSVAGMDIAAADDATRRPKLLADWDQLMCLISLGHNEGSDTAATYVSAMNTLVGNIKTALPIADVVLLTQNPQISPVTAANLLAHAKRRLGLISYGRRSGWSIVDIFPVFEGNEAAYISDADGTHPVAAGSAAWRDAVKNWLLNQVP